jgi:hypothetical protein
MNEDGKVPGWDDGEFGRKLGQIITTTSDKISYTDDKDVSTLAFLTGNRPQSPLH